MALIPLSDAFSKYLAGEYSALQIFFMRNAFHAAALRPAVVWQLFHCQG